MIIRLKFSLTIFCLLVLVKVNSQIWERTYSNPYNGSVVLQIKEGYDKGFFIFGDIIFGNTGKIGWIIKTNLNGEILFEKKLGNASNQWGIQGGSITLDGGIVVTGVCDTLDQEWSDAYILKLDACMNVEWCRIFHEYNDPDYGIRIISLENNGFIFLIFNWGYGGYDHSTWLMHLDDTGEIIWEQEYFVSDTLVDGEFPRWLEILPDNRYLITGYCYAPDSGQELPWWVRPMLIYTDSSGETIWEIPWGYTNPFTEPVSGEGFQSILNFNSIYSCISNYHGPNPGYAPCIIKTSILGEPVYFKDIKENTEYGKASTLLKWNDSILISGIAYQYADSNANLSAVKIDTNGLIKDEKIICHSGYIPMDAIKTFDDKILITAWDWVSNKYVIKLWKLNSDLEYDSIYTQPRTYDSLCPDTIPSGTLFFNCDIITGMQEPVKNTAKVRMKVYPNPACEVVHIIMPECLQRQTATRHFNVTTIFHQWNKELELQVFDGFGRPVTTCMIQPGEKETTIDISTWPGGIYLFRLVYLDTIVATEKVVVYGEP